MSACWEVDKVADGYIKLHRKIWDNVLLNSGERFDRMSAWIWILTNANYKDGSFMKGGVMIHVRRGQLFNSLTHLASVWGWDRKTVRRFLGTLETEKMITLVGHQKGHMITVLNYNKYQASSDSEKNEGTPEGTPEGMPDSPGERTTEGTTTKEEYKKNKRNLKKGTAGAKAGGQVIE